MLKPHKWTFFAGILLLATLAGLLGGVNLYWSRQPQFPAYGLILDLVAVPAGLALFLYLRRVKMAVSDEFSVAKKRLAAQSGLVFGFVLFAITGLLPVVFPGAYHHFIDSMDGADDGFIMGRVAGMLPFLVGILAGQVIAWAKYR